MNITRLTDGRYAMVFMFTTLLLRPDQAPTTWATRSTPTAPARARLAGHTIRFARLAAQTASRTSSRLPC